MRIASALLALSVVAALNDASAQRPGRPMAGRQPGRGQQRTQLEADVRREFVRIVRERVGLNDDQMQKLGPLTRKYEEQRRTTQTDERNARIRLQAALLDNSPGDSTKVNQLVTQLLDIQKRRVAIAEAEQKELGTIMTAHQRARFLGVQEQIRRRLEQMRPFDAPPDAPPMEPGDYRPPPAAQSADSAYIRITVTPLRGIISIDGADVATGRVRKRLSFGAHQVTYAAAGCTTVADTVFIGAGSAGSQERMLSKTLTCK